MRKVDPEKHEAKRRQILDAAIVCFARSGFHKTATAEICAEAGMSPGNLFHYFKTKDALIEAIVAEDQQKAGWYETAGQGENLFEELFEVLKKRLVATADSIHRRMATEILAEAMRNPTIGQLVARNEAEAMAALIGFLKKAVARGQIDATLDVAKLATWISVLADGAFGRAALDPTFDPNGQGPMLREVLARLLKPVSER